jgi:hypothetical protein
LAYGKFFVKITDPVSFLYEEQKDYEASLDIFFFKLSKTLHYDERFGILIRTYLQRLAEEVLIAYQRMRLLSSLKAYAFNYSIKIQDVSAKLLDTHNNGLKT